MTRREALLAAVALPAASKVTAGEAVASPLSESGLRAAFVDLNRWGPGRTYAMVIGPGDWEAHWQAIIAGDDE